MSKIKVLLFTLAIILMAKIGISQECFKMLSDLSGFDITTEQSVLESAACDLRESLPEEFKSQFKVYDFGFYYLSEFKQDGFQEQMDNIINDEVSSPYYLVFGRQLNYSKGGSKLWISLKLPIDPNSPCNNKENQIIAIIDGMYNPLDGPFSFVQAEIEIMRLIKILKTCEDCENEIDDDGDGYEDCNDLDCMLQLIVDEAPRVIKNRTSTICYDENLVDSECLLQNSDILYLNNINGTESAIEYCDHLTELLNSPNIYTGIPKGELLLIIKSVKDFTCWQKSFREEFFFLSKSECSLFCEYLTNYLNNLDVTAVPYEELYKVAYWCQEIKKDIKLHSLLVYRKSLLVLLDFAVWDLGIESAVRLFSAINAARRTFGEYKMLLSLKKTISSFAALKYAQKFGIQTFETLENIFKDLKWTRTEKGVEFHHLIEVRFAKTKGVAEWLGSNTKKWKCIVVEKGAAEHYSKFTKPWKEAIGYEGKAAGWTKKTTETATIADIKKAAREIYKDYPEILQALGL